MQEHNDLAQVDSNETGRTPLQPMGFTDILDGMFSLYRNQFQLFLAVVAVYLVLSFGIDQISVFLLQTDTTPTTDLMVLVFTTLCSFALSTFVVAGVTYASAHVYLGREITPGVALQRAWQRFWTYLGSFILWSLAVGGLTITIIGIPFGIYFSVRWGLYSLPVLFEGTTARNALRRSTELVKGTWWRVFGMMLAIFLIYFMINFILEVSSGFLLSWMGVTETEAPTGFLDTLRQLFLPTPSEIGWFSYTIRRLVSLSISALTMPISVIGSTLLYFDLRIRKEAYDIEMQVTD
ncbi:hypothetical protein C6500_11355 [Candidatus Poribacteria bacterium]|nr:MAG: hypothetical protein C6500_11355 [Candidatus Poribacteria bacterium]